MLVIHTLSVVKTVAFSLANVGKQRGVSREAGYIT